MTHKGDAVVSPYTGSDYTCVTFKPDLARFGMERLDEDAVALLSKRTRAGGAGGGWRGLGGCGGGGVCVCVCGGGGA